MEWDDCSTVSPRFASVDLKVPTCHIHDLESHRISFLERSGTKTLTWVQRTARCVAPSIQGSRQAAGTVMASKRQFASWPRRPLHAGEPRLPPGGAKGLQMAAHEACEGECSETTVPEATDWTNNKTPDLTYKIHYI